MAKRQQEQHDLIGPQEGKSDKKAVEAKKSDKEAAAAKKEEGSKKKEDAAKKTEKDKVDKNE